MKDEKNSCILTALSLIFTLLSVIPCQQDRLQPVWDLNADGKINSTDYNLGKRLILRTISELPISNGSVAFDLNGDSKVDSTDLTALKRYLLGVIDKFPVGTDIPSQTQKTRYQAEDAMLYKAFEETIHAGYDGEVM